MATGLIPRTSFGLPAPHRRRPPGWAVLAWAVAILAGVALGWRALRWADRNL